MNRAYYMIICIFILGFATGIWGVDVSLRSYTSGFFACESLSDETVYTGSQKQVCYTKAVISLVKDRGLQKAVHAIKSYQATTHGGHMSGMRCHALAHDVGNAAAQRGEAPASLLTSCVGMCVGDAAESIDGLDFGCFNGAAHRWVLMGNSLDEIAKKCEFAPRDDVKEACFHGIGHGLSERYGSAFTIAIDQCRLLRDPRDRFQCAHAVFMEQPSIRATSVFPDDPRTYCDSLVVEMRGSCYEFIGYMVFGKTDDIAHAFSMCDSVPEQFATSCRQRAGESLYLRATETNKILECEKVFVGVHECVEGFVRATIDHVNDTEGSDGLSACTSLQAPLQAQCISYAAEILTLRYGSEVRDRFCEKIQNIELKHICQRI
jgi:hypothetical protein